MILAAARRRALLQVLENTPRSPHHKSAGAVVTRPEGGATVTGFRAEERWFPAGKAGQVLRRDLRQDSSRAPNSVASQSLPSTKLMARFTWLPFRSAGLCGYRAKATWSAVTTGAARSKWPAGSGGY